MYYEKYFALVMKSDESNLFYIAPFVFNLPWIFFQVLGCFVVFLFLARKYFLSWMFGCWNFFNFRSFIYFAAIGICTISAKKFNFYIRCRKHLSKIYKILTKFKILHIYLYSEYVKSYFLMFLYTYHLIIKLYF